jgi:oxygen-dependent protoporphyrinogen oxidase
VTRWGGGLPQYLVGHRDLVARLHAALANRPGLSVCGAALDGVGIAACLASAAAAAAKVTRDLRAADPGRAAGATTIERQLLERNP